MKLYVISQSVNDEYDTYDSAVVAAKSKDEAKLIHPNGSSRWESDEWSHYSASSWTPPLNVEVELIGTAKPGTSAGVVLASFNAG